MLRKIFAIPHRSYRLFDSLFHMMPAKADLWHEGLNSGRLDEEIVLLLVKA